VQTLRTGGSRGSEEDHVNISAVQLTEIPTKRFINGTLLSTSRTRVSAAYTITSDRFNSGRVNLPGANERPGNFSAPGNFSRR